MSVDNLMTFIATTGWLAILLGWCSLLCLGIVICDAIFYWKRQARMNRRRWLDHGESRDRSARSARHPKRL